MIDIVNKEFNAEVVNILKINSVHITYRKVLVSAKYLKNSQLKFVWDGLKENLGFSDLHQIDFAHALHITDFKN